MNLSSGLRPSCGVALVAGVLLLTAGCASDDRRVDASIERAGQDRDRIAALEAEVCDHLEAAFDALDRPSRVQREWAAAQEAVTSLEDEQGGESATSRVFTVFLRTADPSRLGYEGANEEAVRSTFAETFEACDQ